MGLFTQFTFEKGFFNRPKCQFYGNFYFFFYLLPVSGLNSNKYTGEEYAELGRIINNEYHIKGNIASNGNAENGYYRRTLHLSYFRYQLLRISKRGY